MSKKTPNDLYCRQNRIFYSSTPKKKNYSLFDCFVKYVAGELVPMSAIFLLFVGIAYVVFSILAGN